MARLVRRLPGRVLILTNRLDFRAHAERVRGCQQALAERQPQLQALAPVACGDDPALARIALEAALQNARRDGVPLVGVAMNRTQCRSTSEDFMVDPLLVPAPGRAADQLSTMGPRSMASPMMGSLYVCTTPASSINWRRTSTSPG